MRRFAAVSALGELRPLAGFLESRLAPLLRSGVARQQAAALEVATELGVDLRQRPRDAVADGPRLPRDAAAVDASPDVHLALVSRGQERLADEGLVLVAREVVLEASPVDLELPGAGPQDDARDRGLALAGGLDPRIAVQLDGRLPGRRRLLPGFRGRLGLGARTLLRLSLHAGALLGAQLALGLD